MQRALQKWNWNRLRDTDFGVLVGVSAAGANVVGRIALRCFENAFTASKRALASYGSLPAS